MSFVTRTLKDRLILTLTDVKKRAFVHFKKNRINFEYI
jgi:hypothetical protein